MIERIYLFKPGADIFCKCEEERGKVSTGISLPLSLLLLRCVNPKHQKGLTEVKGTFKGTFKETYGGC